MKASFVILNYNRKKELLVTISKTKDLIKNNQNDYEIIVVDNASSDASAAAVKESFPDIILIENKINNGIVGWNDGFKVARGRYFIVLDDDSHMETGLEDSINYLDNNPNVGILALNITGGSYETSEWNHLDEAIGFIGCGAIINRRLYEKIGGFAEWLFVYGHEWEYGIRCINAGFKLRFFKYSAVVHRTSKLNRTNKRLRIYTTRNEMALVYTHFTDSRLTYLLRVLVNNLKVIKTEGIKASYYCFLGGIEFLKMRKKLIQSPVTKETQDFFAKIFWGTQPVFKFINRRISNIGKTSA